ncbi:MAG TPA: hypothetical protein VHC21_01955 [Candidatus Saccharimonadales bacterium]|nr:hypothetical protein [Candidatus Saccharimonadales bacterium]
MEKMKFQVPIEKEVYQKLKKQAEELGFDSAQAYVRFWAKSATSEERSRGQRTSEEACGGSAAGLARPAEQALRYVELALAMAPKEPDSVEAALAYIEKHLRRVKSGKYLNTLLKETHQI